MNDFEYIVTRCLIAAALNATKRGLDTDTDSTLRIAAFDLLYDLIPETDARSRDRGWLTECGRFRRKCLELTALAEKLPHLEELGEFLRTQAGYTPS